MSLQLGSRLLPEGVTREGAGQKLGCLSCVGLRSHMVALPQCLIGYTGQGRKGPHKAVSACGDGESLGAVLETSHHICTYRLHELDRDQF